MTLIIIILIVCFVIALFVFWRKYKMPKLPCFTMVTGAVKSGKSTTAVAWAISKHKIQLLKYYLKRYVLRKRDTEKPFLYSNIPLNYKYYKPVTTAHLRRRKRFEYGSVCYLCEASLIADSMAYKDTLLNEELVLFTKLYGHETKGGYLIVDTQAINDLHFGFKRNCNTDFYIHHIFKWLPFFIVVFYKEERYSEDGVQFTDEDVEDTLHVCFVRRSTWKRFDCYCYSYLTDHLRKSPDFDFSLLLDLKVKDLNICTFRKFISNVKGSDNIEKNN